MTTKISELQESTNTVDNSTSSSELIKREEIKNTPFHMVKVENKKGFIAMGQWMLSDELFEDVKDAVKWIKMNQWHLTLKIGLILTSKKEE